MGSNGNGASPATTADTFAAAHDSLRADPGFQYRLTAPDPPPQTPAWLQSLLEWLSDLFAPIGRFMAWIGTFIPDASYARVLLWLVLSVAALLIAWAAFNRVRYGEWRLGRRQEPLLVSDIDEEYRSLQQVAMRSWLEEAEEMARRGLYGEAVHHLLFRSIEDIVRHRPNAVHPALTSREIASSSAIPAAARDLFINIARLVERSLFGGRTVGEADWLAARQSYADLALGRTWRQ